MATNTRSITRFLFASRGERLTPVHWVAVALAATTGVVHLYLYWAQEFVPFLLAGLGFFGAVGLLVAGVNRRLLYAVGVPFTASQIAVWFVQGMPEFTLGVADKTVQVGLILALGYLFVTEWRSKGSRTTSQQSDAVAPVATAR